ncbi:MAG TPA: YbaK/EbsC family protein [Candidatus Limnocylindria bacterium]|nr:YbaK/EbsC family protein [Candidatus Limnocylindria bacterium]
MNAAVRFAGETISRCQEMRAARSGPRRAKRAALGGARVAPVLVLGAFGVAVAGAVIRAARGRARAERFGCRRRLAAYLESERVAYEQRVHDAAYTAQGMAAADHVSGWRVAKVVMVMADGLLRMLVVPAPERIDPSLVREALGAESVRLAREAEFASAFADCDAGAMPPFGNLYGLPTYVDADLARAGQIAFKAGAHTVTMRMRYDDYARLVRPVVAQLAAVTPEADLARVRP